MSLLEMKGLSVSVADNHVIKELNLDIKPDTLTVIMGKNGTGKSSLAYALMGHPAYEYEGTVLFDGEDLSELSPEKIAQKGMFLGFQQPIEVPGVTIVKFLQTAYRALHGEIEDYDAFQERLQETLDDLQIDKAFLYRYLNEGFSGGEKKRLEILQLLMLNPRLAILDEPDSGLDVDAMKVVARGINIARERGITIILITHYKRLLDYLSPDRVVVIGDGKVIADGDVDLADRIESEGYEFVYKRIS